MFDPTNIAKLTTEDRVLLAAGPRMVVPNLRKRIAADQDEGKTTTLTDIERHLLTLAEGLGI
jgi:hypothetical protein